MRVARVFALLVSCCSLTVLYAAKPVPPPPGPEPDWEIVYEVSQTDRRELALTIRDGSQRKTLHSVKGVAHTTPRFTPDGRHVVFTSNLNGVDGIYAIRIKDAAGTPSIGSPTLLKTVTPWSRACSPTVSPEGVLAYSDRPYSDNTYSDVFLMGVLVDAGGDLRPDPSRPPTNVNNSPTEFDTFPSWSIADPPSARRLAFVSSPGTPKYMVCDGLSCGAPAPLAPGISGDVGVFGTIGWSKLTPGLLALAFRAGGQAPEVHVVDIDTGFVGRLTANDVHEGSPTWAPDSNDRVLSFSDNPRGSLVILEDVLARMVSGPGGGQTVLATPAKRTSVLDFPDWRR